MKHVKALSALALAFVLLVFVSTAASAQTSISLTGQLTNDRGEPLPGQRLYLSGPTFAFASTDANGGYAFSVPAGTYDLSINDGVYYDSSIHAPPHYNVMTSSFNVTSKTTLNLQLPFKRLSVHVQDSQAAAIANAIITADGAQASNLAIGSVPTGDLLASGSSFYASLDAVVTNANGDVDLWLLPTPTDQTYCGEYGTCTYALTAQPPSGTPFALTSLSDVTVTQDSSVTITLQSGVMLKGQVTDAQSNPLSGLLVTLRGYYPTTGANTTTDVNGRYAFSVSPGWYTLKLVNNWDLSQPLGPWYFSLTSDFFQVTQDMPLNLPLPFKRVNVHVVDGNNQPVAGVAFDASRPFSYPNPMTIGGISFTGESTYSYNSSTGEGLKTDANGNATLLLLPASDSTYGYTINAYPPPETSLPTKSLSNVVVTADTSLTIRLSTWVILSGRITDAEDNGLPNQSVDLAGTVFTDSSGYYSMTRDIGYYYLGIGGGVPVGSPLHAPQSYYLYSNGGMDLTQDTTLDIALPFKRVNVHVVDVNDQPVAGAFLGAQVSQADNLTLGSMSFSSASSYSYDTSTGEGLKTDANGNGTLWLLPASDPWGGYSITAAAPLETGLPDTYLFPVIVTDETNVTLRFDGALPAKVPVLSSLSPTSVEATSPGFTLVVTGTDYIKTSVVRWNGADRGTTFVSNTQLTAAIPSTDITSPGTANVTVWTPAPGGGESSPLAFTILPPPDLTAPTVSVKGTTPAGDYMFGRWVTQTVQITLTAQDNAGGSGVKKITYAASGAQSVPVTDVVSSTATISITAEGETQVTYSAVDNAGNKAADQAVIVKIDKTVPTLGACPAAGPFLFGSGLQPVGPVVATDSLAGLDSSGSQLSGSVDTSSLGVKTVTFTAKDLAGNSSTKPCDYKVISSATINVFTALHTVGAGTTPGVQKSPLAMTLKIFDLATVASADVTNYATVWNSGPGLVSPLALISGPSVTTFGGGQANLYTVQVPAADSANTVTSGKYLVIGKVDGTDTFIGRATDALAPNSVTQEYLQVIQKSNGKSVPAVTISVPGSFLLITEPAYLEFTSGTELLPIIYDSVDGTWSAVVQADPPQGFVSTPGALSVDVSTGQLAAVQFTVQDVGSQWTTTKVTNRIKHKGIDRTITSSVAMINHQPATTRTPTPTATRTATPIPMTTPTATATAPSTQTPKRKPTGSATAAPTAAKTPKPKPTVVPTSPAPKPTATPKKVPTATPTQTPVPKATATPKKILTVAPLATWTLLPTETPYLTPTPRFKPTKR